MIVPPLPPLPLLPIYPTLPPLPVPCPLPPRPRSTCLSCDPPGAWIDSDTFPEVVVIDPVPPLLMFGELPTDCPEPPEPLPVSPASPPLSIVVRSWRMAPAEITAP